MALHHHAAMRGWITWSEADRLNVVAAAVHAQRVGRDACRLFVALLRDRRWEVLTEADEDTARGWLREYRDGPPPRAVLPAAAPVTTLAVLLSDDAHFVDLAARVLRQDGWRAWANSWTPRGYWETRRRHVMRREDTVHNGHIDQGACYIVHMSCNETPRGSWRAEITLGPADRMIVDGRSAAHAVQQLLAVLPAALAARLQQSEEHTLPTIQAFHPSGCVVFLQVPSLAEVDAAIADLLRRGYRLAAPGPGSPGWAIAEAGADAAEEGTGGPRRS